MKKKYIITWRITLVTFSAVLFVQLFSSFGTSMDTVRVGRVNIPQSYLEQATQPQTAIHVIPPSVDGCSESCQRDYSVNLYLISRSLASEDDNV